MSRLFLLRHARAGWAEPGMRDFDRPLDESGVDDAEALGFAMQAHGYVPSLTLCSNAERARRTLEGIAFSINPGKVVYLDSLYSEDASGYLKIIWESEASDSLLVIGHNPMLEDLASALAREGDEAAHATLNAGFPTSGLAVISFPGGLAKAVPGKGFLEAFLTPAG